MMETHETLQAPFAAGRTAELFPWQDGLALKLFRSGWSEAAVQVEAEKARLIHAAGLPAPAVAGIVQVDQRHGILYKRISGIPLTRIIQTRPWKLIETARWLADLHLELHRHQATELPALKGRLARQIDSIQGLPEAWRKRLMDQLAVLPEGSAICHGDFHPENIYLTDKGPVVLDWMDATRGHPLGDVARTDLLLHRAALPPDLPGRRMIELIRRMFTQVYLTHYFAGQPHSQTEWQAWQALVMAARLAEDIPNEREPLVAFLRAWLERSARL